MPSVTYRFISSGADDVRQAFAGVTQAARQSAAAASKSGQATTSGANAASRALSQEAAAARKLLQLKSSESTEALKASRAAGKEFDAKIKAQERATAAYERNLNRQVAADERAMQKEAAIARRRAKNSADLERDLNLQKKTMEKGRQAVYNSMASGLGRVGASVNRYGGMIAGSALSYGIDTLGAAARESIQLGDLANRISISGRLVGQKYADPSMLKREFENTAIATPGVTATDVAEGVHEYVKKTGDLKTAREISGSIATASSATGTSTTDLASTAAALSKNFDFQGLKDFQQAIATLSYQGKQGAFTLDDAASQFQRLSASAAAFDIGKGGDAVATLGGLSQIAFKGTGSARAATTSLQSIFGALVQHSGDLHSGKYGGHGVEVHTASGGKRSIADILVDTIANVGGGDLTKKEAGLQKIFSKRGMSAINPLYAGFSDAFQHTQGNETAKMAAGIARLREILDENIKTVARWDDVVSDAAQNQKSASAQLTGAWEKMKASLGPAVEKALPSLLASIPPLVDAFGKLSGVLASIIDRFGPKEQRNYSAEGKGARKVQADAKSEYERAKAAGASPSELAVIKAKETAAGAAADLADARTWESPAKAFGKNMTREEFGKEFDRRGGGKSSVFGLNAGDALEVASAGDGRDLDSTFSRISHALVETYANPSQKELISQYGVQLASERATGGEAAPIKGADKGQTGTSLVSLAAKAAATQAAFETLQAAAEEAAKNLNSVRRIGPPEATIAGG